MRSMLLAAGLMLSMCATHATDIGVVGLFPNKALLVVDGTAPKTYAVGAMIAEGIKLIASDNVGITIESDGKRETIPLGTYVSHGGRSNSRPTVTLQADAQGHYVVNGQINGGTVRMLLDTGATMIALPASEAARLGINYRDGRIARVNTANGMVPVYRVRLDTVKVGDIVLNQVDAVVQEQGLPFILLGMSFLKRTEMQRNGDQMVLTKRF